MKDATEKENGKSHRDRRGDLELRFGGHGGELNGRAEEKQNGEGAERLTRDIP